MPGEGNDVAITDSESFKSKVTITGKSPVAGNRKSVEIAIPLNI